MLPRYKKPRGVEDFLAKLNDLKTYKCGTGRRGFSQCQPSGQVKSVWSVPKHTHCSSFRSPHCSPRLGLGDKSSIGEHDESY
ncbi:hypothetical protein J6590_000447 [Homalodisca vitripennis]|nr:hypothetical protein J6590_000447 [Homalodisca vitripennis]